MARGKVKVDCERMKSYALIIIYKQQQQLSSNQKIKYFFLIETQLGIFGILRTQNQISKNC